MVTDPNNTYKMMIKMTMMMMMMRMMKTQNINDTYRLYFHAKS